MTNCVNVLEDTTTVFSGTGVSIRAPGEVRPGHMMLAPLRINLMAPLSTCSWGRRVGSGKEGEGILSTSWQSTTEQWQSMLEPWQVKIPLQNTTNSHLCSNRSVGKYGPSLCLKNSNSFFTTKISICSWLYSVCVGVWEYSGWHTSCNHIHISSSHS